MLNIFQISRMESTDRDYVEDDVDELFTTQVKIIIAISAAVVLVIIAVLIYWFLIRANPQPVPASEPAPETRDINALNYDKVVIGTPETADAPALPGKIVISNQFGQSMVQYGQETPVAADDDEHFQPYMSILSNAVYRSDAAFDAGKPESEIDGNYD